MTSPPMTKDASSRAPAGKSRSPGLADASQACTAWASSAPPSAITHAKASRWPLANWPRRSASRGGGQPAAPGRGQLMAARWHRRDLL
jgi:hypothetical protein